MISGYFAKQQKFQSTLSMRRATAADLLALLRSIISIHALHEESDAIAQRIRHDAAISIHALHEESDPRCLTRLPSWRNFNPRSP